MTGFRPRKGLEWAQALWRRKFPLLVSIVVLLSASIIAIRRVPDYYDARAVIVVSRCRSGTPTTRALRRHGSNSTVARILFR